jgi:hypothetical protein
MYNPLGAPGSTLLYSCLPTVRGAVGGDLPNPQYSWDQNGYQKKKNPSGLKTKEGLPSMDILQRGAGSFGEPSTALLQPVSPPLRLEPKEGPKPARGKIQELSLGSQWYWHYNAGNPYPQKENWALSRWAWRKTRIGTRNVSTPKQKPRLRPLRGHNLGKYPYRNDQTSKNAKGL